MPESTHQIAGNTCSTSRAIRVAHPGKAFQTHSRHTRINSWRRFLFLEVFCIVIFCGKNYGEYAELHLALESGLLKFLAMEKNWFISPQSFPFETVPEGHQKFHRPQTQPVPPLAAQEAPPSLRTSCCRLQRQRNMARGSRRDTVKIHTGENRFLFGQIGESPRSCPERNTEHPGQTSQKYHDMVCVCVCLFVGEPPKRKTGFPLAFPSKPQKRGTLRHPHIYQLPWLRPENLREMLTKNEACRLVS